MQEARCQGALFSLLPCPLSLSTHLTVPCSVSDYFAACGKIPDPPRFFLCLFKHALAPMRESSECAGGIVGYWEFDR